MKDVSRVSVSSHILKNRETPLNEAIGIDTGCYEFV